MIISVIRNICVLIVIIVSARDLALSQEKGTLPSKPSDLPVVRSGVEPREATIGVPVTYRVTYAAGIEHDVEITLPEKKEVYELEKQSGSNNKSTKKDASKDDDAVKSVPIYVIHDAKKEDKSDKNTIYKTVTMTLSFYRPGTHSLPEIGLFDVKDKVRVGYKIPEIVITEINKENKFEEIEPPVALSGNYTRLLLLIAGALLLGGLVVLVIMFLKKRKARREEIAKAVPPIIIFRDDMRKLKGKKLIKEGKVEEYIFGISMIFRRYISRILKIDATEMTSDEIMSSVNALKNREARLLKQKGDDIQQIFYLWDLSKFAEFEPSEDILLKNLDETVKIAEVLSGDNSS